MLLLLLLLLLLGLYQHGQALLPLTHTFAIIVASTGVIFTTYSMEIPIALAALVDGVIRRIRCLRRDHTAIASHTRHDFCFNSPLYAEQRPSQIESSFRENILMSTLSSRESNIDFFMPNLQEWGGKKLS